MHLYVCVCVYVRVSNQTTPMSHFSLQECSGAGPVRDQEQHHLPGVHAQVSAGLHQVAHPERQRPAERGQPVPRSVRIPQTVSFFALIRVVSEIA